MVKITLNENLVPYAGPMPSTRPSRSIACDLTLNYLLACDLIRVAVVLFELRRDSAVFSGYVFEKADSSVRIRIYHKGSFVQEVSLDHLSYGGVLHVEIVTKSLKRAMRFDLLGFLRKPALGLKSVGLSIG